MSDRLELSRYMKYIGNVTEERKLKKHLLIRLFQCTAILDNKMFLKTITNIKINCPTCARTTTYKSLVEAHKSFRRPTFELDLCIYYFDVQLLSLFTFW